MPAYRCAALAARAANSGTGVPASGSTRDLPARATTPLRSPPLLSVVLSEGCWSRKTSAKRCPFLPRPLFYGRGCRPLRGRQVRLLRPRHDADPAHGPVPVSPTLCGLVGSLPIVTAILPLSADACSVGVNVIAIVHDEFAATVPPGMSDSILFITARVPVSSLRSALPLQSRALPDERQASGAERLRYVARSNWPRPQPPSRGIH